MGLVTAHDKDEGIRANTASALGQIGPDAETAIPALTELLKDKVSLVRSSAAEALGKIGSEARITIPAVAELLKDKDDMVRH